MGNVRPPVLPMVSLKTRPVTVKRFTTTPWEAEAVQPVEVVTVTV
jgi:hypothetical protein